MPTGADLEYQRLLRQNGLSSGTGYSGADLEHRDLSHPSDDPVSVFDFGAKAEPGFDNTAAFNAAFSQAANREVLIPYGRYEVTSELSLASNIHILSAGAVLDFTNMPNGTALGEKIGIKAAGTKGSPLVVSNSITKWTRVVTGISSTSGLAVGDLVLIRNEEPHTPGSTRTDRDKGELNVIKTVNSASQITLVTGVIFDYGTTGLVIEKVSPVENIVIDGLILEMGGVDSAHTGIRAEYGRDITVKNTVVKGGEDKGIIFGSVYNGLVDKCRVLDSTSPSAIGNTGYGIAVVEGSRFVKVKNNYLSNCRHFIAGGGYWPASYVDIIDNNGQESSDAGFDCHEPTYYWTFARNRAVSVNGGFTIRGQYITVEDNEIFDSTGFAIQAFAYDGVNEQRQIKINRNKITRASQGILLEGLNKGGSTVDQWKYDCEIVGNRLINIYGSGASTILARHFNRLLIADNHNDDSPTTTIDCRGLAVGTPSKHLVIRGNTLRDSPLQALQAQYVDDISGNIGHIIEAVDRGVKFDTCNRIEVSGLYIRTCRLSGVEVISCTNVGITGSMITDVTNTGVDGINFTSCNTVRVVGCTFATQRAAVKTVTTNYVVVTGNDVHQCVAGTKVNLDASAVNVVNTNNL